jgi:hypothetical protein
MNPLNGTTKNRSDKDPYAQRGTDRRGKGESQAFPEVDKCCFEPSVDGFDLQITWDLEML